jgi:hypothetical protein
VDIVSSKNVEMTLSFFYPTFYRNSYPDLTHLSDSQLETHFLSYGLLERRKYFCPPFVPGQPYGVCLDSYGMRYPDLINAYKGSHELLYQHLVNFGVHEGRDFSPNMAIAEQDRTLLKTLCSPVTGYGPVQLNHACRSVGRSPSSLTGKNIVIAFLDSGFDMAHPSYDEPLWIDPTEVIGDGIDNDGDGYIDEMGGWDFVNNDNIPEEEYAHGTKVTGVATADRISYGGISTRGIAPDAKIMMLKVLDKNGYGSTDRIVKAVDFAIANKARILNVSLNFGGVNSAVLSAFQKAANAKILVVMAAGNESASLPSHVARDSGSIPGIVVGACRSNGTITDFSNRAGYSQNYLMALGEDVMTTAKGGGTVKLWGTSLAAPYVSGTAALLLEAIPTLSPQGIIAILNRTSGNILPA